MITGYHSIYLIKIELQCLFLALYRHRYSTFVPLKQTMHKLSYSN